MTNFTYRKIIWPDSPTEKWYDKLHLWKSNMTNFTYEKRNMPRFTYGKIIWPTCVNQIYIFFFNKYIHFSLMNLYFFLKYICIFLNLKEFTEKKNMTNFTYRKIIWPTLLTEKKYDQLYLRKSNMTNFTYKEKNMTNFTNRKVIQLTLPTEK